MSTAAVMIGACDADAPASRSGEARAAAASRAADPGACDAACDPDARCCTETFRSGSGVPVGWTRRGGAMFPVTDDDPANVLLALKRWVAAHPGVAGLAPTPMPDLGPLDGLRPGRTPPRVQGALTLHRFVQTYRDVPVVGAGEYVTLISSRRHGALAVRGALVDARDEYAGWDAPISPEAARASAEQVLLDAKDDELGPLAIHAEDPTLVAVAEARAMAYALQIFDGPRELGVMLVRADHGGMLSFSPAASASLDDPVPITVRNRTFKSDFVDYTDASKQFFADLKTSYTGAPLVGSVYEPLACRQDPGASPQCGQVRLGNTRVAVLDAEGQLFQKDNTTTVRVLTSPDGKFLADPPADKDAPDTSEREDAALQDFFYHTLASYELFTEYKAGLWDSLRPEDSGFDPGLYEPRVVVAHDGVGCPGGAPGCAKWYFKDGFDPVMQEPSDKIFDEHPWVDLPPHRAAPDDVPEAYGLILTQADSFTSRDIAYHEFGHIVDIFTVPAMIGHNVIGSGCVGKAMGEPCDPACVLDSTDEAEPFSETFADMMGMFTVSRLYTSLLYDSHCGAISAIGSAGATPVHSPQCVAQASEIRRFEDERPDQPGFYEQDGLFLATGRCNRSPGYRQGALLTAWWEWIHAQSCDPEPPFACAALGEENLGAKSGVEAALFAISATNATYYRMFLQDAGLYVECTYGRAMADAWREVWCHHGGIDCAPMPMACPVICGDGVAEDDEACDGDDLRGQSCAALGLDAGDLGCTVACTLDDSDCEPVATPTTGITPGTGSGESSGAGPPPEPEPATDSDGDAASAGGVSGDDACGCVAGGPAGLPGACLMALALVRRRRRLDTRAELG